MQRPILNTEFSSLLNESIQYLKDVGRGAMQEKIDNGEILRLQQMSSYDVDRAYENKSLNVACFVLSYLRSINKYVAYALLAVTVVKIPNFALRNLFSFTDLFDLFSFATLGRSVFVFYFVAELCNHLELYICKYIYNKASLNRIVKFYNRDVEHINRCFAYMSEHTDTKEINDILSRYTSRFVDLFKYPDMIYLYGFAGIIEQQVEEALETDLSNGGMDNLRSDRKVWSIFPRDVGDKDALLLSSLKKADSFMRKVHEYCLRERREYDRPNRLNEETNPYPLLCELAVISVILFSNFTIAIVLGCLWCLARHISVTTEECLEAHKCALLFDNIALNNFDGDLSAFGKDLTSGKQYRRYLTSARNRLYDCTGIQRGPVYVPAHLFAPYNRI